MQYLLSDKQILYSKNGLKWLVKESFKNKRQAEKELERLNSLERPSL